MVAGFIPATSLLAQPPSGQRPPLQGGVSTTGPRPAAPKTFEEIPARYREGFAIFQDALDFTRKAYASPSLVETSEWKGLTDRLDKAVERYEPLQDCLCPMSGAVGEIAHGWRIRNDRGYTDTHRQDARQAAARLLAETTDCLKNKRAEAPTVAPVLEMAEDHRRRTDQAAGRQPPPERNPLDRFLFPDAQGQNAPPLEPFKLGAVTEVPEEGSGTVVLPDGTSFAIEVEKGGGAPKEPGVDWDGWYKKWISTVTESVHRPIEKNFARDPYGYETVYVYRVYPDGRLQRLPGGSWKSEGIKSPNHSTSVVNRMSGLRAPAFPKGSKLPSIDRTFTFTHNMRPVGITLGGPPKEPAVKTK